MKHPSVDALLAANDEGTPAWVAEHLAGCSTCRALQAVAAGAADERPLDAASDDRDRVGDPDAMTVEADVYERREELHRGGMGRATLAVDNRLGREVVLKELHPARGGRFGNRRALASRLRHEAELTARLQHPGIVAVYESGQWANGEPFYAMPFVRGRTLAEALAAADSPARRIGLVGHVLDACDAVAYAHDQGIVHRDLKPDNILVGEFGETVVIDWGLAKALNGSSDDSGTSRIISGSAPAAHDDHLTQLGVGTAAYMPPEQAEGVAPDPRFDVHALGATLYHVLSGVAPYAEVTRSRVRGRLLDEAPTALARLAPDVPTELIEVVDKAMARDPDGRFSDAGELAAELRRFTSGQLLRTHQYTLGELLRRWARSHRAAIAVAAVGLTISAAIAVVSAVRVARERDRADAGEARAIVELERARGITARLLAQQPTRRLDALEAAVLAVGPARARGEDPVPEAVEGLVDAVSAGSAAVALDGEAGFLARSADGRFVASVRTSLHVWRVPERTPRAVIPISMAHAWDVEFSPDASTVAITGRAGELEIVRWREGSRVSALVDNTSAVSVVWIDDEHLVTGSAQGAVELRAADTGQVVRKRPIAGVSSMAALGSTVVIGTTEGRAVVWDPHADALSELVGFSSEVVGIAQAADWVVGVGLAGTVLAWPVAGIWPGEVAGGDAHRESGGRLEGRTVAELDSRATRLDASSASPVILIASDRGTSVVDVSEVGAKRPEFLAPAAPLAVSTPHLAADSLVATESDGRIVAWQIDRRAHVAAELPSRQGRTRAVLALPGGLVLASRGEHPLLWDARTSTDSGNVPSHEAEVVRVLGVDDGFVSVATDGGATRWRMARTDGRARGSTQPLARVGTVVAAAVRGERLVVTDPEGGRRLIGPAGVDENAPAPRQVPPAIAAMTSTELRAGGPVLFVVPDPDGSRWLVSTADQTRVVNPDGTHLATLRGHPPTADRSPFSLGGRLVLATGDGALRVHGPTLELERVLTGHERVVLDASFSADDSILVSASADGTVRRWDLDTGAQLGMLESTAAATTVDLSRDGRWLMAGYSDGSLRIQPLSIEAALARACESIAFFGESATVRPYCDET